MEKIHLVKFNDFNSFASKAFIRDGDSVLTGQALYMACLLRAAGTGGRSAKNEREIAAMLDDPNLETPGKMPRKRS